jgi:hypothetical protein
MWIAWISGRRGLHTSFRAGPAAVTKDKESRVSLNEEVEGLINAGLSDL